jgi:trans-aconitate 2-methyltransferase
VSAWNPQLYLKFGAERTQPARDLAARVEVAEPRRVIDLGCGPGNSTAVLRARWPAAAITGLDSDAAMLAEAARSDAGVCWVQADAGAWTPDALYDVVFSNAMLQWLPDHAAVVERWFGAVASGGALAVQIPSHLHSALHQHIVEVAGLPEWAAATRGVRHGITVRDPGFYYDILSPLAERVDLWVTEYVHVMDSPEAILTWIRSTGLRPFLNALTNDDERDRFEAALLERVTVSYPRQRDGKILFPFRRLFFVAYRGE